MRWSLARMLFLTAAVSLGLATMSLAHGYGNRELLSRPILGGYLAVLATMTAVALSASAKLRRFCLAYSLFGWSYFAFVMRLGLLLTPKTIDSQYSFVPTTGIGILLGFTCAFLSIVFPGPVESTNLIKDRASLGSV